MLTRSSSSHLDVVSMAFCLYEVIWSIHAQRSSSSHLDVVSMAFCLWEVIWSIHGHEEFFLTFGHCLHGILSLGGHLIYSFSRGVLPHIWTLAPWHSVSRRSSDLFMLTRSSSSYLDMLLQHTAGWPPLSQPTKLLMAIRIVSRFFSSLARGISHFFTNTQNAQLRVWKKKKNKQSRAWVSSECKKGEVGDTFVQFSMHLQAIASVLSCETSTKSLGMLTHLLMLVNPASVGQQVLAVTFLTSVDWSPLCLTLISWLLSPADCLLLFSLLPPSAGSLFLFTTLGPSFPYPLPVLWEISHTSPLCGFHAKTDKGILWLAPTPTEMNATHHVTMLSPWNSGSRRSSDLFMLMRSSSSNLANMFPWHSASKRLSYFFMLMRNSSLHLAILSLWYSNSWRSSDLFMLTRSSSSHFDMLSSWHSASRSSDPLMLVDCSVKFEAM